MGAPVLLTQWKSWMLWTWIVRIEMPFYKLLQCLSHPVWTTLTIPYPHDPFYRLTNMGSHGRVAMMTK